MYKLKLTSDILLSKTFLTPTDTMDELKTQFNKYFIYLGESHFTCHVFVQMSCVNLREDKYKDMWKTVYFPQVVCDDSDVEFMFRSMVVNEMSN